jgi:hypothetical protein
MRSPHNSTTTEKQDSLVALEQTVCAAHAEVSKAEGAKLSFALKAGEALLEILGRKLIRHGQKTEFYRHTCGSKRTASIYIQLAENRVLIEKAKVQSSALLSIDAALRLIRQAKGTSRSRDARSRAQLNLSTRSEEEVTAALRAYGFDKLMQVMPLEFRSLLQQREGAQIIRLMKTRHPNRQVKNLPKIRLLIPDPEPPPTSSH